MIEEPPIALDEQTGEDATESAPTQVYTIEAYMKAGRTCDGVIRALRQELCMDPHDEPPLYTAVDCDALEQLFRPRPDDHSPTGLSLTFTYDGYTVTITAEGRLTIQP